MLDNLISEESFLYYFLDQAEELNFSHDFTSKLINKNISPNRGLLIKEQLELISMVCGAKTTPAKMSIDNDSYDFEIRGASSKVYYKNSIQELQDKKRSGPKENSKKDWAMDDFIKDLVYTVEKYQKKPISITRNNQYENIICKIFKILQKSLKLGAIPVTAINRHLEEKKQWFIKHITKKGQTELNLEGKELEHYVTRALEKRRNGETIS